jgi:hypothetical protein
MTPFNYLMVQQYVCYFAQVVKLSHILISVNKSLMLDVVLFSKRH